MADMLKWLGVIAVVVLGLILVLEPTLISMFPMMIHYLLGISLIVAASYGAYKLA